MRPERRFLFRLGLALGKTVKQLKKEIDSKELTDWKAYYQIEPFGVEQDYIQAGIISSVIANVNRGKNSTPYKPSDFVPSSFKAQIQKKQSVEDIKFMFQQMAKKKPKKEVKDG